MGVWPAGLALLARGLLGLRLFAGAVAQFHAQPAAQLRRQLYLMCLAQLVSVMRLLTGHGQSGKYSMPVVV